MTSARWARMGGPGGRRRPGCSQRWKGPVVSEEIRTPPYDNVAEQSVLGGMMLSKDAIADVGESVRSKDFYKPAHELIFDAIIDLYSRGEPADEITVSDELSKKQQLQRIGGPAYLHNLAQSVPTAASQRTAVSS